MLDKVQKQLDKGELRELDDKRRRSPLCVSAIQKDYARPLFAGRQFGFLWDFEEAWPFIQVESNVNVIKAASLEEIELRMRGEDQVSSNQVTKEPRHAFDIPFPTRAKQAHASKQLIKKAFARGQPPHFDLPTSAAENGQKTVDKHNEVVVSRVLPKAYSSEDVRGKPTFKEFNKNLVDGYETAR